MIERTVLLIVGLTVFSISCLWQQLQNRRMQYRITSLQEQVEREQQRQKRLRIDVERLRSPSRLDEVRKQRLTDLSPGNKSTGRMLSVGEFRDLVRRTHQYAGMNGR